MSRPLREPLQVANLVLTTLLLVAVVANLVMTDPAPPASLVQSVKSISATGAEVLTERAPGESLESWRDRHLDALKGFAR